MMQRHARFFGSRATVLGLLAATLLALAFVAPVSAAASPTRFSGLISSPPENIVDDCTGLAGTVAATGGDYFGVELFTPQGYHYDLNIDAVLAFTFEDGSRGTGSETDHQTFVAGPGATVYTNAHYDTVAIYNADGSFKYFASYRVAEHWTVSADGTLRVAFEIGHFRGGC
jgi:hypothetical protein